MNNKIYFLLIFISVCSFSQTNDSIIKTDSLKVQELREITIKTKLNKAGVYQLELPKKILENETLDKTIKRIDFVTIDNSKNIYFKGSKIKSIYFNNQLITVEEFNKLNIEDTRAISIDLNSFNQTTGEIESVIKISEKKKLQNNIKGNVDFSQGFFQKFNYYGVNLSNKINKLSSRLQISNLNNQTENSVNQRINLDDLNINAHRKLSQPFFLLQNVYDLNDQSSIYIKNKYSVVDENIRSDFSDLNELNYRYLVKNYSLNAGFDKKIKSNYHLKLNFDYIHFNNYVESGSNSDTYFDFSKQKFNEFTLSPFIQFKEKKYDIVNSLILTNREYDSYNNDSSNKINQNIITYFLNFSLSINDKSSLVIGSRYQYEKNNMMNKDNNYFLPNITYSTKIDSIAEIEFSYRRKLLRPSINSISNSVYLDNNGNKIINPAFLLTQINNIYGFDVNREFKYFNFNLSFNYNFSKNFISTLYGFESENLTNTTLNVDDYREGSVRTSLSVPLWGESKLNVNYSFTKLEFKEDINRISGLINYYDVGLSGALFKNYLYTLNSFYVDRFYEYNAFYKAKPDFSFSISKNYLKNNGLNISLEFRNILNQDSNRTISFMQSSNYFFQESKNQSRLLLLSLTYNFGKDFKMNRKYIQNTNSDIKLK